MRVSQRGQITIPKPLREQFGLEPDVEVELTPTEDGLLIRKCGEGIEPESLADDEIKARIASVYGILSRTGGPAIPIDDVDEYIEEIRGR